MIGMDYWINILIICIFNRQNNVCSHFLTNLFARPIRSTTFRTRRQTKHVSYRKSQLLIFMITNRRVVILVHDIVPVNLPGRQQETSRNEQIRWRSFQKTTNYWNCIRGCFLGSYNIGILPIVKKNWSNPGISRFFNFVCHNDLSRLPRSFQDFYRTQRCPRGRSLPNLGAIRQRNVSEGQEKLKKLTNLTSFWVTLHIYICPGTAWTQKKW